MIALLGLHTLHALVFKAEIVTHSPVEHRQRLAARIRADRIAGAGDLEIAADTLGFPLVLKIPDSAFSRGVKKASNLAELKALDAGANFTRDGGRSFPWRGRGVRVPAFDELIDALPRQLPCIIELKTPAATEPLREAVRRHNLAPRIVVAGFDARCTLPLRGAGFALGASTRDVAALLPAALLRLRAAPRHVQALCIPPRWHGLPVPIAGLARAVRGSGTVLHVWTVNEPAHLQHFIAQKMDAIITDCPDRALQLCS